MHTWRCLFGLLLPLSVLGVPAAATISDSTYSSPDLRTSTISPWNPAKPIRAARAWETAVRLPGRVVSLPFVAAGALAQGSMVFLDRTNSWDRAIRLGQAAHRAGIEVLPASLGDHTGIGGELRWAPPYIDRRLLVEVNATTNQYNRERVTGSAGPVSAVYSSSWRPRELYFGPGLGAEHSGESTYGERSQSATLVMTWGWQHFDSARVRPFEPIVPGSAAPHIAPGRTPGPARGTSSSPGAVTR